MAQLQIPPLADGEIYIGSVGDAAGNLNHVILLPGDNDHATWQDQLEWAGSVGGDLPTRVEMAMLYTDFIMQFTESLYWARDTACGRDRYAPLLGWYQSFSDGSQDINRVGKLLRARAVRRVLIRANTSAQHEAAS